MVRRYGAEAGAAVAVDVLVRNLIAVLDVGRVSRGLVAIIGATSFVAMTASCSTATERNLGNASSNLGIATVVEVDENNDVLIEGRGEQPSLSDAGPTQGGVFLYEGSNWIVPDPAFPDVGGSVELHLEVFSGLMRIGTGGEKIVEPELADRYSISPDGLTYEFVLKQGLVFSDGSPLTAADVKWSWERSLSPRTDSVHSREILGMIEGADGLVSGRSDDLIGVVVIDDRTIRVKLSEPRADFPLLLADPSASVLKKSNVEKWRDEWSNWYPDETDAFQSSEMPVGTGPFKIVDLNPEPNDLRIVLQRNEHYHGRPAYLEGVVWVEFPDLFGQEYRNAQDYAFGRAEVDALYVPSDIAQSELDSDDASASAVYFLEADTGTFFAVFNPSVEPFDDRHFRRALVSATNVAAVNPNPGLRIADAISPPGMPYRGDSIRPIGFDTSLARDEWEQSRYHGEPLIVVYRTYVSEFFEEEMSRFSESWIDVLGVTGEVEVSDYAAWESALARGEIGMTSVSISAANPDPHAIFGVFESLWGEEVDSDQYEIVLDRLSGAASELDRAKRVAAYQDLEQYLLDEALAMPLLWFDDGYFIRVQPWVHNFRPSKWSVSRFKDVWFDDTAPERVLPLP